MEAYYTPTVAEKRPPVEGLETIPVRLKEEAIVKYLSQTIYSSWKSALRELYANELTAAKKAERMGAKPTIEITLDPKTRELTIQGKDSLGITGEKFRVLRYYGRSGNFLGEDAGQFGLGAKSFVMLSDTIRIETRARETGERYGVIGVKGVEFRPIPDEELTIDGFGTRVSLPIRSKQENAESDEDDKEIKLQDVVETLENVCKFAEIDTYLELPSPLKTKTKYTWSESVYEHTERDAGRRKLNRTPKEYARDTYGEKGYDFEYDAKDFHFYGYLAVDREGDGVDVNHRGEVRLVGMPIEVTVRNPDAKKESDSQVNPSFPMSFWYVNLKDERKFMPTADRERLKEGLFEQVNERVIEILKGEFARMVIRSFDDYRNSPFKPILNCLGYDSPGLRDYFDPDTRLVCSALGSSVGGIEEEDNGECERWRRRWSVPKGAYEAKVRDLVAKSGHVFMLSRKRKGNGYVLPLKTAVTLRKVLRTKYPDAEVFLHPGFEHYWSGQDFDAVEKRARILREHYGIPDAKLKAEKVRKEFGKDWRRAVGIETKAKAAPEEAVVWVRDDYKVEPVKKGLDDIGKNTVRVRGNIRDWVNLLRKYYTDGYGFTKEIKGMDGGMTEEGFAGEVSSTKVMTAKGETTVGKASEPDKELIVFRFDDPEILEFYKPKGKNVILAPTAESAFGAIAFLKLAKKAYDVVENVGEGLVKPPVEPLSKSNPAEMNYLYIAQKRMGRSSANEQMMELLRNALSNSMPGEMKSLVDTAVTYSRYLK
ncbi:MAG: hypothetical protein LYZ70_04155 [Nitrososphaerales archaeon]|nr:hypothetical protein [Nitrososphaerales archaeon]